MKEDPARWWGPEALDRGRWGALVEPLLEQVVAARDRGRLPHALLLVGPPGLGRELAAVEVAALTVCGEAQRPWHEGHCADRVRRGLHPDVVAMMPDGRAHTIKIDPLREELVEVVGARPYEGQRRVWILDGVEEERLPKASGNAILKTLEEPPSHALFLLLAANPDAVLPTIRSRCQRLGLPGAVAVARRCLAGAELPELAASALSGVDVAAVATTIREALAAGMAGDPERLLLLAYTLPDEVPAFGAAAAVAAEMAAEREAEAAGEELARLAVALLATERRSRALNLNPRTQLVSCLMRWYREFSGDG